MRTALMLLFLLAVAAIPGSVLPQRAVNIEDVQRLLRRAPGPRAVAGPAVGASTSTPRPGSPRSTCCCSPRWSAASCPGCATTAARCAPPPPDAPKRLDRLPQSRRAGRRRGRRGGEPPARLAQARGGERADGTVTVVRREGYLKETGNLLFHFALLAVLVGVGLGSWYGWHGNRLLVAGPEQAFCNTVQQYDEFGLGPRVDARRPAAVLPAADRLPGADYLRQRAADVVRGRRDRHRRRTATRTGTRSRSTTRCGWTAPTSTCSATATRRCCATPTGTATAQTTVAPFLSADGDADQRGRGRVPGRQRQRQGRSRSAFDGLYLPTTDGRRTRARTIPAERDPALMLIAYRGDLGLDAGIPSSVYELDQRQIDAGG